MNESWISRFTFEAKDYKLTQPGYSYHSDHHVQEAILLKGQLVVTLLEYAHNKMIAATQNGQLVLITDWKVVQVCKDSRLEDSVDSHGYISTLACFDPESFPFVAWANSDGIYIVNLKESCIEPLALT